MSRKEYRKPQPINTDELCFYGCGNVAKYLTGGGKYICETSPNRCIVNKSKNSESISAAHQDGRIPGWNKNAENGMNRAWSKGLDKSDLRVKKISDTLIERYKTGEIVHPRTKHTVETKEKISIARIEYLENSEHVKWYTCSNGIKVQGTWERNIAEHLINNGYTISRHKIIYDNHRRYTPDLYVEELDLYVEVKGWLSDRDINKYKMVYKSNPNLKIILIRDELGIKNYTNLLANNICLSECEDLKYAVHGN